MSDLFINKSQWFAAQTWTPMPVEILYAKGLSLQAKTVYLGIVSHIWKKDTSRAWPRQEIIAKNLDVARTTINGYMKELRNYGLIFWIRRGLGKSNMYALLDFPVTGNGLEGPVENNLANQETIEKELKILVQNVGRDTDDEIPTSDDEISTSDDDIPTSGNLSNTDGDRSGGANFFLNKKKRRRRKETHQVISPEITESPEEEETTTALTTNLLSVATNQDNNNPETSQTQKEKLSYVRAVTKFFNTLHELHPDKITQDVTVPRKDTSLDAHDGNNQYSAILSWYDLGKPAIEVCKALSHWVQNLNKPVGSVNYFENFSFPQVEKPQPQSAKDRRAHMAELQRNL